MDHEIEIAAPSFFDSPFNWLMDKLADMGRQRLEETQEYAEHRAGQKMETYLAQNPEFAAKAVEAADIGLEHGTISPALYEMLKKHEAATDHAPAPQASPSVASPEVAEEKSQTFIR